MKKLTVIAAGLGWSTLEKAHLTKMCGLTFSPRPSVFPAVTCVAQASLRTGLTPAQHGLIANGTWFPTLRKPLFWEQSARLIQGPRIWEKSAAPTSTGLYFFQQSLGENIASILSPAPIHKHGGGMMMACYTKPTSLTSALRKTCGAFPLWRYWGPLASPKVGRACLDYFEALSRLAPVDNAYLYLPTLDYYAQKYGPSSPKSAAALSEFSHQLSRLTQFAARQSCSLEIMGDYEIHDVTLPPVRPNVTLRQAGLFQTRTVGGLSYPDFYQSTAFAMCDHEFCALYGEHAAQARDLLLATGDYVLPDSPIPGHEILLSKLGSWCEYKWWTNDKEAPDFATHVDIHNKPGFDPTELFFFGRGTIRGTHGRPCLIAHAQT